MAMMMPATPTDTMTLTRDVPEIELFGNGLKAGFSPTSDESYFICKSANLKLSKGLRAGIFLRVDSENSEESESVSEIREVA
jgi:hypothetical protein